MKDLYRRHGEIVNKHFWGEKLSISEIVELAHIRKKLNIDHMRKMFGEIMNDLIDLEGE